MSKKTLLLSAQNKTVSQTDKNPCPHTVYILVVEMLKISEIVCQIISH